MIIKRKSAWPEILANEIAKARTRPFEFGSHDCCMFASRIVKAMTGTDPAKKLRGYKTATGATRMLQKVGKGTLLRTMDWVMKEHGCDPKVTHVALLRRGDVCMAKVEIADVNQRQPRGGAKEWAVGICIGSHAAFASDGVVLIPMKEVSRGWHCG